MRDTTHPWERPEPWDYKHCMLLEDVLHRIDVSRFSVRSMKPSFRHSNGLYTLSVTTDVNDRETGKPTEVVFNHQIDPRIIEQFRPKDIFLRIIRDYFGEVLMHELDECFLYRNKRIFDPHKGKQR